MLPIRPVRGIKRYEEHLDFYKFSMERRRTAQIQQESQGRHRPPVFPYDKEAGLHAAEDLARTVAAVLGAVSALKGVLEELDESRSTSVLHKRIVLSSEPDAVTAQADSGCTIGSVQVSVRRLASGQVNRSALFVPDAPTVLESGLNRLDLRIGGQTTRIDLYIHPADQHRTVLTRLRNEIQAARTGVKAFLETDSPTGRIRLVLQSLETGTDSAFDLSDRSGNAASATGLLVADQRASHAEIRMSGDSWQSYPSNRIPLPGRQLTLQLHKLCGWPVVLDILPDARSVERKLLSLLHAVNGLEQTLHDAGDVLNPDLPDILRVAMDSESARAAGFTRSSEGAWVWDGERWSRSLSLQYKQAVQPLTGPDSFLAKLRTLASAMEDGPSEALLNRAHPRYMRYANYLATLDWYSQLPTKGLLLNKDY